jgi:hypothetical protein
MAKSGRSRAPRDRRRPIRFPKPPCSPKLPFPPEPVKPADPGCSTGPDPRELVKKLRRKR